jgi:hypothetical protein
MRLLIQLASLIVIGFFVVKRGEDTTWKFIYAGIIAAPMILGFALTILIQSLMGSPDDLAIMVGLILGYIGLAISGTQFSLA